MKHIFLSTLCIVVAFAIMTLLGMDTGTRAEADPAPAPTAEATPAIVTVEIAVVPTPAPTCAPSPTPVLLPELPDYEYEGRDTDIRISSRAIYSITPKHVSPNAKRAVVWVGLNRKDDPGDIFPDELRYVYLQPGEFKDYDPDARRTDENNELAREVLNAWRYEHLTGDDTYRLVPRSGVKCDFYLSGKLYEIKVYDMNKSVVYDSGTGAEYGE